MQEILDRVKAILLKPVDTWPVIKSEAKTEKQIYTEYVMILAAVPLVAGFLGQWLFGYGLPFFRGISWMVVAYALSLVGVFVMAKIVDALAPSFQGQKSGVNSLKLVAYSMTASWVIGVVAIIPSLAPLQILGLYSIYLFYVGLPHLMECPADKTLVYTIAVLIIGIVVFAIIGAISASIVGLSMMSGYR
jgi:hypothetical protein